MHEFNQDEAHARESAVAYVKRVMNRYDAKVTQAVVEDAIDRGED